MAERGYLFGGKFYSLDVEINRKSFLLAGASALILPEVAEARTKPISMLPESANRRFAWTVDDGVSSSAIGEYLNLASKNNVHLTFFVTSAYPSWKKHSSQIIDLLAQKKIQLGNHTVHHKNLTETSPAVVRSELEGCHNFLLDVFDYDARPYFRPTYGYWNQQLLQIAGELGYTVPVMWYGSLGIEESPAETLRLANKWIANGRIVIDHANSYKSSNELLRIFDIINHRKLKSVTLREAFGNNFK